MTHDRLDARQSALGVLLGALEESDVDPNESIEVEIRVRGREDKTLKIELRNARELKEILRLSLGVS